MNSCYDMATASIDAANGGASNAFTADQEVGLNVHNDQRALHGSQMMTLSATLNADAQSYADQLAAQGGGGHDTALLDQLQQGENLFQSCCNQPVDYSQATMMWYNEFILQVMISTTWAPGKQVLDTGQLLSGTLQLNLEWAMHLMQLVISILLQDILQLVTCLEHSNKMFSNWSTQVARKNDPSDLLSIEQTTMILKRKRINQVILCRA